MNDLQSISRIFEKRIFRIPNYQREYTWEYHELNDFWQDILRLQINQYHYMGVLTLKLLSKADIDERLNAKTWLLQSGYRIFHIIDGHQRLITITSLINGIIDFVRSLPENEKKSFKEIYIGEESLENINKKYICMSTNSRCLETTNMLEYETGYLDEKKLNKEKIKIVRDYLETKLTHIYQQGGMDSIVEIYHRVTLQVMFNVHEITQEYVGYDVFEVMHNRGRPLTNFERLKSRLIYLTTLYSEEELVDIFKDLTRLYEENNGKDFEEEENDKKEVNLLKYINNKWIEMYVLLRRKGKCLIDEDIFLEEHCRMYFSETYKGKDHYSDFLLKTFSRESVDRGEIEVEPVEIINYVNSLVELAKVWCYTFYPKQCKTISKDEQTWIEKINRLKEPCFRIIIAISLLPCPYFSGYERVMLYKAIERFIFINFAIAMFPKNYKSNYYLTKAKAVYRFGSDLSVIAKTLNAITDKNIDVAIRTFILTINDEFLFGDGFYSWDYLYYFFSEYEYTFMKDSGYGFNTISWEILNTPIKNRTLVEHILPQELNCLYWRNNFRQFTKEEIITLSSSIGNLIPLSESISIVSQNEIFDEKREKRYMYFTSHSEYEIFTESGWDAQHIYNRGIKLLQYMELRWNFKFESVSQMEKLLHIGFVKENRDISNDMIPTEPSPTEQFKFYWFTDIINIIKKFIKDKSECNKLYIDYISSDYGCVRFTTATLNKILPNAVEATSGWDTKNYYFYEIRNNGGESISMQFVLSTKNIPHNLKVMFDKVNKHYPSIKYDKNIHLHYPFATSKCATPSTMKEQEVEAILENQYMQTMEFETTLIKLLKNDEVD